MPTRAGLRVTSVVVAALLAGARGSADAEPGIQDRLAKRIAAFHGEMGVAVKNLDTGETFAVAGGKRFPTASLIKVAVMAEAFHQMAEGRLRADTRITLREEDKGRGDFVIYVGPEPEKAETRPAEKSAGKAS